MKNLLHKLGVSATVGIATCLVASAPASATSAWEAAKQVDNQATAAGAVGSYIGLADGGNGLSTAFFEQTVGGNLGYYAIRRGASDSAWGAPAAISTPSTASGTSPITAAADAGGNALGLSVQNQGGVGGIFASPWLASASAPGAYGLIMSSSPAQGGLSDPAVAFDSSGRGYAVAGAGQGNANGDEPILLSVYTPSGGWSTAAPIAQNSSATSCTTKQICGQEPRLAVSPDGTVVIAYLSAMPSPIPGGPSTYQLNAVRAPVGAAAGSGGANSFTAPQPISSNPVPISQGPGGNGTPEVNFDVTIDASDTATIVDAESQSGVNNAVFATQWAGSDSKPGKPTQISGSQSFPPEPPAADPRVVSSGSRDVTAAWTESGPNPQASTIIAAELPPGAKGWSPPTGVSASTQGPGGGADAPATNVPPFALAEDSAATALLTWTNGGSVMWSGREVSGGWTTPGSISGASGAVNGTLSLSAGPLNQGDAMWVQSSNGRNAVFASRFSGLSSLPPTVSGVSPNSGTGLGNTVVRITGSGFTGATAVNFGNFPGQSVSVDSDTQITVTTPPGQPGTVDVTVTTPNGTSATSPADHYTYQQAPPGSPTVTGVNPSSGPAAGGTTVKIAGTNFSNAQQVMFGSQAATKFTVDYDNQITAVAPAGSGTVDVTVTTLAGTSATSSADHFTYVSSAPGVPTVSGVSPNSGPAKGGTSVTVKGTNLSGATAVHFGPNAAASFNVDSGTQITATSPAGSGTVDVTVTTGKGTSAVSGADQFTYTSLAGAPPN
ncbi:MAG TPA: IPT/TIG domain-containing protein, partial [Solirubrobacteraceae bacterium]|nr:IPT/TIG domain-containing protein [Solirubrobacteraceae bacterium]